MNKRLITFLLLLASSVSYAGLSSNFAVTTDYVWRGVSQTTGGAAVQGGLDYEMPTGLSFGTWLSNAGTNSLEADLYTSYSFMINDDITLNTGAIFYHYKNNLKGQNDTLEFNLGANLWMFDFAINYTNDYFATETSSLYYVLSTSVDLMKSEGLSLGLSLGLTTFSDEAKVGTKNYLDYKLSLDRTKDNYTTSLFYTDTNRKGLVANQEIDTDDHVLGLSLSRSF